MSTTNTLCIEDKQIASISEINSNCDGPGEVSIMCNGTAGNYNCTDLGDRYKITGLQHSGVKEYAYTAPPSPPSGGGGGGGGGGGTTTIITTCTPNWQCTEWSECQPNGKSTRTCTEDLNKCGGEKPSEERNCYYYVALEGAEEVVEEAGEIPPAVAAVAEPTLAVPTPGMLAITGATIGSAYQQRPFTMGVLTVFILLIVGLFIYAHVRGHVHWPFHFKHPKKKWLVLVIIVLLVLIALFIHFVLLTYAMGNLT